MIDLIEFFLMFMWTIQTCWLRHSWMFPVSRYSWHRSINHIATLIHDPVWMKAFVSHTYIVDSENDKKPINFRRFGCPCRFCGPCINSQLQWMIECNILFNYPHNNQCRLGLAKKALWLVVCLVSVRNLIGNNLFVSGSS